MFEIYPTAASDHSLFSAQIGDPLLVPTGRLSANPPYLQVGYNEIDGKEIDLVLSYASISATNAPLGVPRDFEPFGDGKQSVTFPIAGLRKSLECYLKDRATDVAPTATQDFAAAVDEIAAYCEENDLLLVFRW